MRREEIVLVTGATGFVGSHLLPALLTAGWRVRATSRNPDRARRAAPRAEWVYLDVEEPESVRSAVQGCHAAYYLVHGIASGSGYPEREAQAARCFARAAEEGGLRRIVYLGGVAPSGKPSRHLRSRLETGRILQKECTVSTVELRAAMIIGAGSESWKVVRDLAERLPAMVLPRWLRNHSWPVSIEDVVAALLWALDLPDDLGGWYDIPGPERVSHRELIRRVARAMHRHPPFVNVPVLTPRLSSYWIGWVTRVDLGIAQELVEGLRSDLDPSGRTFWNTMPGYRPIALTTAILRALEEERATERAA